MLYRNDSHGAHHHDTCWSPWGLKSSYQTQKPSTCKHHRIVYSCTGKIVNRFLSVPILWDNIKYVCYLGLMMMWSATIKWSTDIYSIYKFLQFHNRPRLLMVLCVVTTHVCRKITCNLICSESMPTKNYCVSISCFLTLIFFI